MKIQNSNIVSVIAGLLVVGAVLMGAYQFLHVNTDGSKSRKASERIIPVEIAPVSREALSLLRTFNGTVTAHTEFTVAPKVSGKVQNIFVNAADTVSNGDLVVKMDDAEFRQGVLEAEARLAVAQANKDAAISRFAIATRQLERSKTLNDRGIASESAFDTVQTQFLTSKAEVSVAEANLNREEALLKAAKIRLGYTEVRAEWESGDETRTVAERLISEGHTVAANTPILSIVEMDPVTVLINVTERDYPLIQLGQTASIATDGVPGKVFEGTVNIKAPVFREASRQATIEITVPNPKHELKPGMFARCILQLQYVADAISVPDKAITRRADAVGVFNLVASNDAVAWVEVEPGFKSGSQVQILAPLLAGSVVIIGQQFLEDGTRVRVIDNEKP